MPATDGSSNGGARSSRSLHVARSSATGQRARDDEREATIDQLGAAVGELSRGAAALKAENRELRAEIAGLEREAAARQRDGDPIRGVVRLAEVELPIDSRAPSAARIVVDHCLSGLVTRRVLCDAEMLVSELVTNSLDHADLGDGDGVLVRVYLATDVVRLEVENPGTRGIVAADRSGRELGRGGYGLDLVDQLADRWGVSRDRSTCVWLEMARA